MDPLVVDRQGSVCWVRLNRPERRNAITHEMWPQMTGIFTDLSRDIDVRVVILTGSGNSFCSGLDLASVRSDSDTNLDGRPQLSWMRDVSRAIAALHEIPQPTIARVRGPAVGGGWGLALACDFVIAAQSAQFSAIFSKRGLSLDSGCSWFLPRLVGMQKAKELALMSRTIGADEAQALGLVATVVPDEDIDRVISEWVAELQQGAPIAMSLTKGLLHQSLSISLQQALESEASAQSVNWPTADRREAFAAFLAKREPRFVGR